MENFAALAGFLWLMSGCMTAYMAAGMGRNAVAWGVCGFLFPPTIVALWVAGRPAPKRRCPFCAEFVLEDAIKCRHCHSDLTGQ